MGYNAHTLNLFDECEALAEELARINPADELLFYSNTDTKRTEDEKEGMTVLFIENFFPDGAPTNDVPEEVLILALSSFKIALQRSIQAAPLMIETIKEARRNWL